MTSSDVKAFLRGLGLLEAGIAALPLAAPEEEKQICPLASGQGADRYDLEALLPGCQAAIVILFPYYNGSPQDYNISLYAQGQDYHLALRAYLAQLQQFLEERCPGSSHYACVDTSPLADRWLAYEAGLGFIGDNDNFINRRYGSYCYIGSLLTTIPLAGDAPDDGECQHCSACRQCCPGQCLDEQGFHYERCKSFLTQKKGSLTLPEIEILQKTPLIFGCDECQRVCPHNAGLTPAALPEFRQDLLPRLTARDLQDLSNRQFRAAYGSRAFAWRGKAVLLRNLEYCSHGPLKALDQAGQGDDEAHGNND